MKKILIVSGPQGFPNPLMDALRNHGWEVKLYDGLLGLAHEMDDFSPDYIHVMEGMRGWWAAIQCRIRGWNFTTTHDMRLPHSIIKPFHAMGSGVLVQTHSAKITLEERGFENIIRSSIGIDTKSLTGIAPHDPLAPILLHVGEMARGRNLEAFFDLDIKGRKLVAGSGPMLNRYRDRYPEIMFTGGVSGDQLAAIYSMADVFVYPGTTLKIDIPMIEAMASGTPVAAFPVPGPQDVLCRFSGAMDSDLSIAINTALTLDRRAVAATGQEYTWERAHAQFVSALVPR